MVVPKVDGEWRSLAARLLWEQEAGGSNPPSPTAGREGCNYRRCTLSCLSGSPSNEYGNEHGCANRREFHE